MSIRGHVLLTATCSIGSFSYFYALHPHMPRLNGRFHIHHPWSNCRLHRRRASLSAESYAGHQDLCYGGLYIAFASSFWYISPRLTAILSSHFEFRWWALGRRQGTINRCRSMGYHRWTHCPNCVLCLLCYYCLHFQPQGVPRAYASVATNACDPLRSFFLAHTSSCVVHFQCLHHDTFHLQVRHPASSASYYH